MFDGQCFAILTMFPVGTCKAFWRLLIILSSSQIDAKELQKALVNGNWSHFSEEACRMMIDMFDKDKSGQINLAEFGALFQYINQWKGLFEGIDRDRSGFIDTQEFSQALNQMGYRFSQTFVQVRNSSHFFVSFSLALIFFLP